MREKILTLFFTLLFIPLQNILASNRLNLFIEISESINPDKIKVLLDDGVEQKFILTQFKNNKCNISETVDVLYAAVNILYPDSDGNLKGVMILVNPLFPSVISFNRVKNGEKNQLSSYKLENGIDVFKCKEYFRVEAFCKILSDSNKYYSNQFNKLKTDSILNLYNSASIKLAKKQMTYIGKHGNEYFYFWYFRLFVANVLLKTHQLELYEFYNTVFPEKYKESNEGKKLKSLIAGRLFIKEGGKAPDFSVVDYKGNVVSSENNKDKYILLNFWATWCSPCIAEIPLLKKIRSTYAADKLEMISVSYDTDSAAFIKAIKRFDLNWTNVYSNTNLQILYGKKPIPSVYLIDTNGIILFSSWHTSMDKLEEVLKLSIKQ